MAGALIYVDRSEIREGKLEELKSAVKELVDFVEANETRPLVYNIYVDEDTRRMTVVQIHPDSESLELHMKIAGPVFLRFVSLVDLLAIDIYGEPSAGLLAQLKAKAQMLGTGGVDVHHLEAGLSRVAVTATA